MDNIGLIRYPNKLAKKNIYINIQLDIEPVSKARPRFKRDGHVYTTKKTSEYEEYLGWKFKEVIGGLPDAENLFGIRMVFSIENRKRIDIDNMAKAVLDAATGIVWRDDNQVRELMAKLFTDSKNKISILIYRLFNDSGIKTCPQCGEKFRKPPSLNKSGYCSKKCWDESRRKTLRCKECGNYYTLPQSLARLRDGFCSRSCASKWWHKHSPKAPSPQTKCVDCGKKLSRREYTRCLACAIEHRRENAINKYKSFPDFVKPLNK